MKDTELILMMTRNCNGTFRKGLSSYLIITMQLQGHVLSIKTDLNKLKKKKTNQKTNLQSSVAVYSVKKICFPN